MENESKSLSFRLQLNDHAGSSTQCKLNIYITVTALPLYRTPEYHTPHELGARTIFSAGFCRF